MSAFWEIFCPLYSSSKQEIIDAAAVLPGFCNVDVREAQRCAFISFLTEQHLRDALDSLKNNPKIHEETRHRMGFAKKTADKMTKEGKRPQPERDDSEERPHKHARKSSRSAPSGERHRRESGSSSDPVPSFCSGSRSTDRSSRDDRSHSRSPSTRSSSRSRDPSPFPSHKTPSPARAPAFDLSMFDRQPASRAITNAVSARASAKSCSTPSSPLSEPAGDHKPESPAPAASPSSRDRGQRGSVPPAAPPTQHNTGSSSSSTPSAGQLNKPPVAIPPVARVSSSLPPQGSGASSTPTNAVPVQPSTTSALFPTPIAAGSSVKQDASTNTESMPLCRLCQQYVDVNRQTIVRLTYEGQTEIASVDPHQPLLNFMPSLSAVAKAVFGLPRCEIVLRNPQTNHILTGHSCRDFEAVVSVCTRREVHRD